MTNKKDTCAKRIDPTWKRIKKDLLQMIQSDNYEGIDEYILGIDTVEAEATTSPKGLHLQHAPYGRVQFCAGGPTEELRFYENKTLTTGTVEFALLDWFDGATLDLSASTNKEDNFLAEVLWDYFSEFQISGWPKSGVAVHDWEEA